MKWFCSFNKFYSDCTVINVEKSRLAMSEFNSQQHTNVALMSAHYFASRATLLFSILSQMRIVSVNSGLTVLS